MNSKTIITISLVIFLLIVCWVVYQFGGITKIILSNVALNEEENLREAYIASIELNYNSTDTVIVETAWSFCGNDVPGDRPVIFSLNLEDTKTKNLLQKRLHAIVLTQNEAYQDFEALTKEVGNYNNETYITYYQNKKSLSILAEKTGFNEVIFYEYSEVDKKPISLKKHFVFKEGKWTLEK